MIELSQPKALAAARRGTFVNGWEWPAGVAGSKARQKS